jgi:hypothetical protein
MVNFPNITNKKLWDIKDLGLHMKQMVQQNTL